MLRLKYYAIQLCTKKNIVKPAICLFFLYKKNLLEFKFPGWQSLLTLGVFVLLGGGPFDEWGRSLGWYSFEILMAWYILWLPVCFIKWWLRRAGRWDGQGPLFNLLVASWLVADLLYYGLSSLDVPWEWLIPLDLYSVMVSARAISTVVPMASLGYCFVGCCLSIALLWVPGLLVMVGMEWLPEFNWSEERDWLDSVLAFLRAPQASVAK